MRVPIFLILACLLSACVDEQPMSSAPSNNEDALYATDGRPADPRVRNAWLALATPPYNGIDVLGSQPYEGAVLDVQDDGFAVGVAFFPDPNAFVACACFGFVDYMFAGVATRYNFFAVGGSEIKPWWPAPLGPLGSGRPVLFDLFSWRILDLPRPTGAPSAIVTGLGRYRRPFITGTAFYRTGLTKAVGWHFNRTTREYELIILPGGDAGTNTAALNARDGANLIVGSVDGHPATWQMDNPAVVTVYPEINGEFRDVNADGVLIGMETGGSGFMMAGGVTTPIAMEPAAINDRGYVVGMRPSGAVMRLKTGVLRDLPMPAAAHDFAAASAVTNWGLIVGTAGTAPVGKPATWGFYPGPDGDRDLVPDAMDNCPTIANSLQEDTDEDFVGNHCVPGSPPVPVITANATTRREGGEFVFNAGASTDPMGRTMTFAWDFGDGTFANGPIARKVYVDEGSGTHTVTLTANNGVETADATTDVVVLNSRPNLTVTLPGTTWPAGSLFAVQLDVADAGINDTFTYVVYWGDTTSDSGVCATNPCTINVSHTYSAPGTMAFKARVNDGVISGNYTATLDIQ